MIELKPCPFCGFDAQLAVMKSVGVSVKCTNAFCKCQTVYMYDNLGSLGDWPEKNAVDEVIKRWNRREMPSNEKTIHGITK